MTSGCRSVAATCAVAVLFVVVLSESDHLRHDRARKLVWTRNIQSMTAAVTMGSSNLKLFVDTTVPDVSGLLHCGCPHTCAEQP
jgi:hypothetical protein